MNPPEQGVQGSQRNTTIEETGRSPQGLRGVTSQNTSTLQKRKKKRAHRKKGGGNVKL